MKPILFNTPMVQAILDGRKTQTRRAINNCDHQKLLENLFNNYDDYFYDSFVDREAKYKLGDILWVREPARVTMFGDVKMKMWGKYLSDDSSFEISIPDRFIDLERTGEIISNRELIKPKWILNCSGIPNGCIKELARIFLKVTDVRVERLQQISFNDVIMEGVSYSERHSTTNKMVVDVDAYYNAWKELWNSTAKDGFKWKDNPYVFVYEFERSEKDLS